MAKFIGITVVVVVVACARLCDSRKGTRLPFVPNFSENGLHYYYYYLKYDLLSIAHTIKLNMERIHITAAHVLFCVRVQPALSSHLKR